MGTTHRPTTARTNRTLVALGATLLAAGALGACTSSGGTTQTGAQVPVTTTVTSTTAPAASTTTSADAGSGAATTTTASGGAGVPGTTTTSAGGAATTATTTTCRPSQLTLRVQAAEGGGSAGHVAVQLVATNTGSTVCTTQGYPGVSLVAGGTGQQLGAAADRAGGQATPLLRLEPGKTAVATIQVAQAANFPSCGETTASGLRVYLPGVTAAAYVPYPLQACSSPSVHQLQVQPFTS